MGRIAEALKKAQRERVVHAPHGPAMNDSIRSEASFRYADQPVHRAVPAALKPLSREVRRAPATLNVPASSRSWPSDPQLVTLMNPAGAISEQYRAARTWLLSRIKPGEQTCLALTGSQSSEGTSVSAANLAVVMSEVSHMRVLVVDANLRRASLAGLFQLPPSPGLAEVLSGGSRLQSAIIQTPRENLYFLPAGSLPVHKPAELLNSRLAANVFDHLRESFDYILVDTPAIQDCSDVGVIGALCSGIVVVVRMHQTPAPIVQQSIQWLQDNRLNVIGCLGAHQSPDARN